MNKNLFILVAGFIFISAGLFLIGMDFFQLRESYQTSYYESSRLFKGLDFSEKEPKPYTEEWLKSDLRMAEEYLRQNSYDSMRKAMEIYNRVISFAKDPKLHQLAKYGLSYSLFRLNDENAALFHLKELKKQKILDPYIEEEVDFLLGKILLFRGHEDEGNAILKSLLAKTTDNELKSRIHATFGDYYQLKGNYKKAKKSYMIALEYDPDSQHLGDAREKINKKLMYLPFEHEYYDLNLYDTIVSGKRGKLVSEKKKMIPKKEETKTEKETVQETKDLKKLWEEIQNQYKKAVLAYNGKNYDESLNLFIEIDKKINELSLEKLEKESISKEEVESIRENINYRLGDIYHKKGNFELSRIFYEKVLNNINFELDQAAYVQMGILFFEKDNYKEAYKYFKQAITKFPNGRYYNIANEWLTETEKMLK